jgi:hypothetical protein
MPQKKAGGRPRKYSTVEEARRANLEGNRRRRLQQRQPIRPTDFIAFEPLLRVDIPTETPLETGLRTSCDVRIPLDPNARQGEVRPSLPSPRPNPPVSAAEEGAEINEQIRRIQIKEQEMNTE